MSCWTRPTPSGTFLILPQGAPTLLITKISLRVDNLDTNSLAYLEMDPELEDDLIWSISSGVLTSAVLTDDGNPVELALDAARKIRKLVPGAVVAGAHDELVSISDIARRVGVAAEGVRLWADGKRRVLEGHPFPRVEQAVTHGKLTVRLFAWRHVVSWVRAATPLEPDEGITYLSDEQLCELNARLHHEHAEWRITETALLPRHVSQPVQTPRPRAIYFASTRSKLSVPLAGAEHGAATADWARHAAGETWLGEFAPAMVRDTRSRT